MVLDEAKAKAAKSEGGGGITHVRGRGQQFQGPGFRVFGQNLIKISTNARSKQHLFAVVLSSRWR